MRFQDAGLCDIVIDAGLVAEGSMAKVFDGKNYKRAVRVHKIIYEAMMRMMWIEFKKWIEDKADQDKASVENGVAEILLFTENVNQDKFDEWRQSEHFHKLEALWIEFKGKDSEHIDIVFYTYKDLSIKQCE